MQHLDYLFSSTIIVHNTQLNNLVRLGPLLRRVCCKHRFVQANELVHSRDELVHNVVIAHNGAAKFVQLISKWLLNDCRSREVLLFLEIRLQ